MAEVLAFRRPREAKPETHPLVKRWRSLAQDPHADPTFRSALNRCANELEKHERGES